MEERLEKVPESNSWTSIRKIKEGFDECTKYCFVKDGDEVKKGQVIGKVGPKNVYGVPGNPYKDSQGNPTNGATTGCHCHFTVKKNGETIDPLTILK